MTEALRIASGPKREPLRNTWAPSLGIPTTATSTS
jgi:hypothetical protein